MSELQVLSVASEAFPLIKTGGLADVVGALPTALSPLGLKVRTLLPGYPGVIDCSDQGEVIHHWRELFGGQARLLATTAARMDLLVLDAPHLYRRPGNPYMDENGKDWADNAERFAALSLVAAEIGVGCVRGFRPDVIHVHDWQAALAPAYLRYHHRSKDRSRTPVTILTVHNLAYQGQYPATLLPKLKLPIESFTMDGVEYYGQIGFLKAGLALSNHITTVSPTYALEIQEAEMGMGLDGLLRHRSDSLSGILNGIDTDVWNPATDRHLVQRYDRRRISLRQRNKEAVRRHFGLPELEDAPLIGVVSRLAWQKGMDLLLAALPRLLSEGGQLALLGAGEPTLQDAFMTAAARYPGRVGVILGYDETLAHLIQGGADAILMPSRFEPCGLTQLCGLRYGAVPIVARVGGLADTIIDANEMALAAGVATGFQFWPVTVDALGAAIIRALRCYRDKNAWREMQKRGMATDVSWRGPAARYASLYQSLTAESRRDTGTRHDPNHRHVTV